MSTKRIADKHSASVRDIARRVRERREFLGVKRERLAELIGVSYTGYSAKEIGTREFGATELVVIAQALGVTTDYLLSEENIEDLRQHEIVKFFNGLPEPIQRAELEHMRALHRAHIEETGPKSVGGRNAELTLLETADQEQ